MGHIDATASDLEPFEMDRLDDLERADKGSANLVFEVRRTPVSPAVKKLKAAALASLAPGCVLAGVAGAALLATAPPLAIGALALGLGEGALLFSTSRKGLQDLRFADHQSTVPPWKGTRTYEVGPHPETGVASPVLSSSRSTQAPDGKKLGAFLADAMQTYPAKRYAFVLSGHGRAMDSVGDVKVADMAEATAIAHARSGRKLDVMVLDSCLVGNFETLLPMADHVRYAIVSEEPVYTSVIDWRGMIEDQQHQAPSATAMAASAMNRAEGNPWHQTLSTVRMSQMPPLRTALENLGSAIQSSARNGHRDEIKAAFKASARIKDSDAFSRAVEQKIDLGDAIKHLAHDVSDPQVKNAASEAWHAYQKAVVDHRSSKPFSRTTGLSIQGPRAWHREDAYAKKAGLPEWSKALGQMRPWPMRVVSAAVDAVRELRGPKRSR